MANQKVAGNPNDDTVGDYDELQPGTKLLNGQYTITAFLNNGGFGITYLAKDSLNRTIVIKECFLNSMCRRTKTLVVARSRAHQAELRSVVQLFIREAHNLSMLVHPNIVAVHQVFEDKGTAYMAIDYIDGSDLLEMIENGAPKFAPDEIVRITEKLLGAVKFIHENSMLHRDISPDNILINKHGEPMLIDFGAAREQSTRRSRALTALRVVKDGYSPQEFYIAGSEQGPWSDLYALAATLYHVITGQAPANGQARLAELAEGRPDSYVPLAGRHAGFPKGFLEAIDKAMKSVPRDRVQTASEWLAFFRTPGVLQIYPERHAAQSSGSMRAGEDVSVAQAQEDSAVVGATLARHASGADVSVPKSGGGMSGLVMAGGLAAVLAVAGLAFVFTRGGDAPMLEATDVPVASAADTTESVSVAPVENVDAVAAPEVAVAEVAVPEVAVAKVAVPEVAVPEVAVPEVAEAPVVIAEETPVAEVAPIKVVPEVIPEVVPEVEVAAEPAASATPKVAVEDVAATKVVAAKPPVVVPVAERQITFAAWDVDMPFAATDRISGGKQTAVISRVAPGADLSLSGGWIGPGVTILAVNDQPIVSSESVVGMVLGALRVDPDGYARVAVRYIDPTGSTQTGLLAVEAVRTVILVNGIYLIVRNVDGKWITTVQSVKEGSVTSLLAGDILFRDKFTGTAIDGPETMEAVMTRLVEKKVGTAELSVIRGSKVQSAFMQLAIE